MAMPPQGQDASAPQDPQGSQSPQDPQSQQGGDAGAMSQLLQNVDGALQHILQFASQSKQMPPEAKQAFAAAQQAFSEGLEAINGGGDDQGQAQGGGPGQTVPPEAGGNKGAIPSQS